MIALAVLACYCCKASLTSEDEPDIGLCFDCMDRAELALQESMGVVWLPCACCHSVQVAASEGFHTCIDCPET